MAKKIKTVQDFLREGWDREQAENLILIQQGIQMEQDAHAAAQQRTQALTELVERYEAKWPEICYVKGGSRARKGMEIVLSGGLWQKGVDHQGNDLWAVGAHVCSKAGGFCSCEDRVYVDPKFGKLCAHRLAVALKTNWGGDRNEALLDYLKRSFADSSHYVDLLVERDYFFHGNGDRVRVAGCWLPGRTSYERLTPAETIDVTLPQFQWALNEMKWGMAGLPVKLPGQTDYFYRLIPGEGLPVTQGMFYHRGMTWAMEHREMMRRLDLREIARNLEEFLSWPFPVALSEYEAKRVHELRVMMKKNEVQAADVWAALPEELRISILENEAIYAD